MVQRSSLSKFNKIDNPVVQRCIMSLFIKRFSVSKISEMLLIDESKVKKFLESPRYSKTRKNHGLYIEFKKEAKRRRSRSIKNPSPYKKKRVENLWLSGKGREKIVKETGYSDRFVKTIISDLVVKHGKSRPDARKTD